LYTTQKSKSHYVPQPYTNQSVFKSLLNCASEMSLSRDATGREFQRHGPATKKLLQRGKNPKLKCIYAKTNSYAITDRHLLFSFRQSRAGYRLCQWQ